ncbi:MAG: hypothetical protein HC934_10185 [Acaryochloridaceae cyanobacterium SU_2_1]|nr:hypothetical protein [Acaryochloridaceae cyanobacterium SU_2_1]
MAFQNDNLEIPPELLMAAQVTLTHRAMTCLQSLEQDMSNASPEALQLEAHDWLDLAAIATEAEQLGCHLNLKAAQQPLQDLILRLLWQLFHSPEPDLYSLSIKRLQQLLTLGQRLHINLRIDRAQELYLHSLQELAQSGRHGQNHQPAEPAYSRETAEANLALSASDSSHSAPSLSMLQLRQVLQLGEQLKINVQRWLDCFA